MAGHGVCGSAQLFETGRTEVHRVHLEAAPGELQRVPTVTGAELEDRAGTGRLEGFGSEDTRP